MAFRIALAVLLVLTCLPALSQSVMVDDDVEGLTVKDLPSGKIRLTWNTIPSVPCAARFTYSVFRSTKEDFDPAPENRIAQGLSIGRFETAEPISKGGFYYRVEVFATPVSCPVPKTRIDSNASAYRPLSRLSHLMRLFDDDKTMTRFTLETSWIPGPANRGVFRYQLTGTPAEYPSLTPEASHRFSARLQTCSFFLNLYDESGFKLTEIDVPYTITVDADSKPTGIQANSAEPLGFSEYKHFAEANPLDSWAIAWKCR